jgi:hypothetical protein
MSNATSVPHDHAATLTTLITHNMTPIEIEALAEELMQDAQFSEADAYGEAVSLFPSLYLHADVWDFYALCHGNDDAAAL